MTAPDNAPVPLSTLLAHRPWVRALARTLVRDDATVDDVEQKTWLAALRSPPEKPSAVRSWLARVVRNAAYETGRTENRRRKHEAVAARPDRAPAVDDVVADAEQHKRVVLAVTELDEPYRTTVLLRFYEGLPPREVARRMGVPVETVRTRTRRGLERVRERFDRANGGDRAAWRAALAPLLAPAPLSGSAAAEQRKRPMKTSVLAALGVAALLVGAVTVALWDENGTAGEPPVLEAVQPADDGGAVPRRRRRDRPPVAGPADEEVVGVDEAGEEVQRPTVRRFNPFDSRTNEELEKVLELPESMRGEDVKPGRLIVRTRIETVAPRSHEPMILVAEFENAGAGPTRLHLPEHTGMLPFPVWRLVDGDGRVFAPRARSFQSMAPTGVHGAIVTLAPGEKHTVRYSADIFTEVLPENDERTGYDTPAAALPAGRYVVSCMHTVKDQTVPFTPADGGFNSDPRTAHGLWVGVVRSGEVSILVEASRRVLVTVEGPETIALGRPHVVRVNLENPGGEAREIPGTMTVSVFNKGRSTWVSGPVPIDPEADADAPLVLAAGEKRVVEVDVTRLGFRRRYRDAPTAAGLFEVISDGAAMAVFDFGDDDQMRSEPVWLRVKRDRGTLPDGISINVRLEGGGTNGLPVAQVELLNGSDETVRLPNRLAYPADVYFRIRAVADVGPARFGTVLDDSDAGSRLPLAVPPPSAVLPTRLHWSEKAYVKVAPLVAEDFVVFGAKRSLEMTIDLGTLVDRRAEPGRYLLTVGWRNLVTGARLGVEPAAVVGVLAGEPIEFDVAPE